MALTNNFIRSGPATVGWRQEGYLSAAIKFGGLCGCIVQAGCGRSGQYVVPTTPLGAADVIAVCLFIQNLFFQRKSVLPIAKDQWGSDDVPISRAAARTKVRQHVVCAYIGSRGILSNRKIKVS